MPEFSVKGMRSIATSGLVEVMFERPHSPANEPFDPVQSGRFLFDPQSKWCIVEAELNGKDRAGTTAAYSVRNEFSRDKNGFPIPVRTTARQIYISQKSADSEYVTEFDVRAPDRAPPDDHFTLAAFGLPEPLEVDRTKRVASYIWLLVGALACLGLGLWLRAVGRRARHA